MLSLSRLNLGKPSKKTGLLFRNLVCSMPADQKILIKNENCVIWYGTINQLADTQWQWECEIGYKRVWISSNYEYSMSGKILDHEIVINVIDD